MPARTCDHLKREYFGHLDELLWCVRCDGNVAADGTVTPRSALTTPPPVAPNYGERLERVLGKRISLRRRGD